MNPTVKGNQIKILCDYLKSRFGNDSVFLILETLDSKAREELLKPIIDITKINEQTYVEFIAASEKVFGSGDYKLARDMGSNLARESISKFYRIFIKFGDPMFVVRRSNSFWKNIHNTGKMVFTAEGNNKARGIFSDFPYPDKTFCHLLLGFFEGVLEMCGVTPVNCYETACAAEGSGHCEYLVEWK